jgi:PAS domain S-box-containing protein
MTSRRSILVVEDERVVAKDLQRRLVEMGYDVPTTCATGDDAVRAASDCCPDLVLVDIRIKGQRDGIEVAEVLRGRFDVPAVYLTAYADESTVARAKATAPYGYLIKPVKPDELRTTVEIALHKHDEDRRLRERERRLTRTFDSIAYAIVTTDSAGVITCMNRPAAAALGTSPEGLTGRDAREVVKLADRKTRTPLEHVFDGVLVEGRAASFDAVLVTSSEPRPVAVSMAPLVDEAGGKLGAVLAFQDLVQSRVPERQELSLAAHVASLGTLAAGLAYEVARPLSGLFRNGSVVAAELAAMESEIELVRSAKRAVPSLRPRLNAMKEATVQLLQGADQLGRVLTDLRAFTQPGEREDVDVGKVIESAVRGSKAHVQPRTRLIVVLENVPRVVAGESRLVQVFVNLIVNAAQAIGEGGPGPHEIRIQTQTDHLGRVVVKVRDTGCGMAPEVARRAFDPFFTTKVGKGAGLGLSACHGIVTALGGEISVRSEVGVGSEFTVALPASSASTELPGRRDGQLAARPRVLVVDDEAVLLAVIKRALGATHEVSTCSDATAALRLLEEQRFDAVLCDVMMPGLTGLDVFERISALSSAQAGRFAFMSGGGYTELALARIEESGRPMLRKPFDPDQLRAFVAALLARGAATDEP